MSRTIDVSKGYSKLSERDKLHLLQRGKLPEQFITDDLRAKNDLSGRASLVAYGGNTGSVRTATVEELEAEIARRKDQNFAEDDDPRDDLMPDLKNPHSERLSDIEDNRKETERTQARRDAARQAAASGPAVPTRGHPAASAKELVGMSSVDDDEDVEFTPTVERGEEAYTGKNWTNDVLDTELEGRGLVTEGNKTEKRARLIRDDQGELEDDDVADDDEE